MATRGSSGHLLPRLQETGARQAGRPLAGVPGDCPVALGMWREGSTLFALKERRLKEFFRTVGLLLENPPVF